MDDAFERKTGLEARHHFVLHEVLHFERHAGQRHHDASLALEPHAGCRAVGVEKHGAALRHEGLRAIQLVECNAALGEHPFDMGGDGRVVDQAAAEGLGERLLGNVVLGGA